MKSSVSSEFARHSESLNYVRRRDLVAMPPTVAGVVPLLADSAECFRISNTPASQLLQQSGTTPNFSSSISGGNDVRR
jgi:hypothetical protein